MDDIKKEINGKRLMILGGSLWKDAIKQFCDEYGVIIVAAGNDPTSGICDIADEYYNVDSTDSTIMKKLIVEKHIDGIYMGGNEPVIAVACQYINEMGFPCYCTKEQWDALQNKSQFKKLCLKFGLPVAKSFKLNSVTNLDFPVITKPVDGSGSHGFSVCRNKNELKQGYALAAENSFSREVIIEQLVPNNSIGVIYTVSNGKLIFSAIEDKYPVYFEKYGTYVGGFFDFESGLVNEFRNLFEDKIQKLVRYLNIREGNFWIEVFYDKGNYFFNEVGFRYGGSATLYPVDYFSGINQVAADIYYSLTGKSRIQDFCNLYNENTPRKKKYAIYPVFFRSGRISLIQGCDVILNNLNILNILSMKKEGHIIPNDGSFGRIGMLVHFVYDDLYELKTTLNIIHSYLTVTDENGADMVLRLFDVKNISLSNC